MRGCNGQGYTNNRLQLAVLREAFNIMNEGIADAETIDTVVKTGRGFYEWTGETGQAVIRQRDENLIRQLVEDAREEA